MRRLGLAGTIASAVLLALVAASPAAAKNTPLAATLSGASEVPGPGDPDGSANALLDVKIKPEKKKGVVCFLIPWDAISAPTAGHIHQGGAGTAGPIVVPLFDNAAGETLPNDCVKAKSRVLKRIGKTPEDYYVNLHNELFPDAAIRGQLSLKP